MRPALRQVLFWCGISLAALVVGAPLGIAFSLYAVDAQEPAQAPLLDPLLISPKNGAFTSLSPTLKWGGDPVGGHFEIEISGDPAVEARAERHTTTENFFTREEPFAPGASVWWRVRAVAADGAQSPWSPTWSFTPLPGP